MTQQLKIMGATDKHSGPFSKIEDAIAEIRKGELVIVVDDEDRENEGDLTIVAENITADVINFLPRYGRGLRVINDCRFVAFSREC